MYEKDDRPFIAHVPPGGVRTGIPSNPDGSINYRPIAQAILIANCPIGEWQTIEANVDGDRGFFMVRPLADCQFEVGQSCLNNIFAAEIFKAMDEMAPGRVIIGLS